MLQATNSNPESGKTVNSKFWTVASGLCFVGWNFHSSCAVESGSCIVCGFVSGVAPPNETQQRDFARVPQSLWQVKLWRSVPNIWCLYTALFHMLLCGVVFSTLFNEWRQRKCALKGKTQNEQSKPNQTEQSMSSLSVSNDFSVPTEPFSRRHVTLFCPRLSSDDVPLQAVEATSSSGLQILWCESMQKMMNYCKKHVNTLWKHAKTCKKKGPTGLQIFLQRLSKLSIDTSGISLSTRPGPCECGFALQSLDSMIQWHQLNGFTIPMTSKPILIQPIKQKHV